MQMTSNYEFIYLWKTEKLGIWDSWTQTVRRSNCKHYSPADLQVTALPTRDSQIPR
jgi:hypothetical protein